jgi:hypothetical protein
MGEPGGVAVARLSARVAPDATSSSARAEVRFHTVVGWPASWKVRAIVAPIAPSPTTVTGGLSRTSSMAATLELDIDVRVKLSER